jgi:PAS domain S-box-containing protein
MLILRIAGGRKRSFGEVKAKVANQLRLVVDTIPTLAWVVRRDGSAEFFNRRWLDYTGLSREQAVDWGFLVAIHPDDVPRMLAKYKEALNSGQPFEMEGRFRRFDGEFRWFLFRGSPWHDESGKVVKWYGTNTDLEDRKRAEEVLRASEQNFRLIVDSIPGLVNATTANGEVELVSQRVLDFFGKTFEEVKKDWVSLVHPDDRERTLALWGHSLKTGEAFDYEHRVRRADGVYRWFHSRGTALRDAEGNIIRWYFLLTDIDGRKKAEENLRRSEAYLLEAQKLSQTGSFGWNAATGEMIWSEETFRIFGCDRTTNPTLELMLRRIHPEDTCVVKEAIEQAAQHGNDFDFERRLLMPDGSVKNVHVVAHAQRGESGRVKHLRSIGHPVVSQSGASVEFLGTAMDVTEHWQARTELEKAFEEIKRLKDRLQDENVALREQIDQALMFEEIVGSSPALEAVLSSVVKVAPTDSTVLLTGETGTGKELIARAIHKRSARSSQAFVAVNCAAIPDSLIASELFGHEKGAFTGAFQRRLGRFEIAEGGTIFLDEVGELPPETQVALLRVLQEREFERVGGGQPIRADVRVIAATNRDLRAGLAVDTFRRDLFYRLHVFPIQIPPLRERREDIPTLVEYFISRYARRAGRDIKGIQSKSLELLKSYSWPGNIRELQNVIERAVIVHEKGSLVVEESWLSPESSQAVRVAQHPFQRPLADEKALIEETLAECGGKVSGASGAAAKLGLPPSTLETKIRSLRINKYRFKVTEK